LQRVAWARGARAGADLRHVAVSGRRTALGAGRLEHVRGAVVGDAVAALGDVAVARGRTADCRALRVGRAGGARAGAELGGVAGPGRGTAFDRRRLEGVGGARGARAGAELGGVTRARGAAALEGGGLEGVGRAGAAPAGAEFRDVAWAGGR